MNDQRNDARDAGGPFGLYDCWPFVHLAIGAVVLAAAALTWPRVTAHPRWFLFLVLAVPLLVFHQFEENGVPGGFRRWYNLDICLSSDADRPLSKKQVALNHMSLMIVYPAVAVAGSRWPWLGLAGIYALVADGLFHLSATGITRRYSPGLATGLLLYIPLGVFATWYLVTGGDVRLPGLLAAVLSGSVLLNVFVFLPTATGQGRPRSRSVDHGRSAGAFAAASATRVPAVADAGEVSALASATGVSARSAAKSAGDDSPASDSYRSDILPSTRRLAAAIIPFLAFAFIVLFITPGTNGLHFAFDVQPRMSAMMLGATYLTGVVYFGTVLWARAWHQVRLGLLPVALFATMLGIATVLDWSDFNHGAREFWLWNLLYFGLPPILPIVWLRNERHARPVRPVPGDVPLGGVTRAILVGIGVGIGLVSALLFVAPAVIGRVWPWPLSPLTSRVLGAEFGLFSLFGLQLAADAKWSRVRDLIRPQLWTPLFFLGAIIASWSDFDHGNPMTIVFVAFVVLAFVIGFPALFMAGEARRRSVAPADPS